jgi:thiol-disulfide isomerase/thioredoxin
VTRLAPVVLLLAAAAAAADKSPTPAEKLASLQKEQAVAETAYFRVLEAMSNTPGTGKKYDELWELFDAGQADRFAAAVEIAKADPKSDLALSALEWVLTTPRSYYLPAGVPALELVTEHHAANPKVGKIVAWVGGVHGPSKRQAEEAYAVGQMLIAVVAEKNPDRTARGQAHVSLALQKSWAFSAAEYERTPDRERQASEAEAAYEQLAAEYGDCRWLASEKSTIGDLAARELNELRNLRVGKVAPGVEAEGVDGKKFKLSDTRGKVTVLVFWASWCGPCMEMVPHERALAARLKDKPFAIVGVNGDEKREKAREVMAREWMTWPSFWNGDGGPDGPITKDWNVYAWPTVYVLDAKGVIRFKGVVRRDLDKAVDDLLKEMEPAKK